MRHLDLAKRRAAQRAAEGGGVIFVIALTLAVLTAIGAWALQSAAIEIRTSGYERQSTQTHYLSEYGVLLAMQDMNPGGAQTLFNMGYCHPNSCASAPSGSGVTSNRLSNFCLHLEPSSSVGAPIGVTAPVQNYDAGAPTTPGSLGAIPVNGDFWVELTEPTLAGAPPGFSMNTNQTSSNNGPGFYQLTLTAYGMTQQQVASTNPTALWGSEGLEQQRVRIVAGPLTLPSGCR